MPALSLILASLAASQGQAVEIEVPDEPHLVAAEVRWDGRNVPLAKRGSEWLTVVGIDLEAAPGPHYAEITLRYGDGRKETRTETIEVAHRDFPTTRLSVEPKYVELSREDQARADRESREIDAIYSTVTPEAYWNGPFAAPIPGITGGRNFGHRRVFNGQPRAPHSGADLTAATGTPVHASNAGRVVLAKNLFFSGNSVFIDHGLGVYSVYLHLSVLRVKPGDRVERGQVIGLSGATGRVTGPHLHWGVRVLDARVDPFSLLELPADERIADTP
ncbi:MAG TPA: M23 family metallopeptidase [Gammaproteobacteria bacterium]|nr:M23 family metallopeptidase [Gammaproteobacteria bacterium]